jgi:putative FmdB family regulatory protein
LPLYEYRCLKCKRHIEKIEKLSGPNLKKCPHCRGKVESVITAPAIHFKGAGWYVTDYGRGKTSGADRSKAEQSEKSEKTEKSSKSASQSAAPAKEEKKSAAASKEK